MKRLLPILFLFLSLTLTAQTKLRDSVYVKTSIFEVVYSEVLEQPKWLKYRSTNRPTNVDRAGLDFYKVPYVYTSDAADYAKNEWDKGHLAPAATFADTEENMKSTFSYLNCALQQQELNRGEWRLLEEQERKWDDKESLTVRVDLVFTKAAKRLPTLATVPDRMVKHIYFEKSKKWQCYDFPNQKPTKGWELYNVQCKSH